MKRKELPIICQACAQADLVMASNNYVCSHHGPHGSHHCEDFIDSGVLIVQEEKPFKQLFLRGLLKSTLTT